MADLHAYMSRRDLPAHEIPIPILPLVHVYVETARWSARTSRSPRPRRPSRFYF